MNAVASALRAGQAYCYTNTDHEEMEIIFVPAYGDNVAASTNSEEKETCCSHYEQYVKSKDTTAYCDYLDQLAQDLCADIASALHAIEQLSLDTGANSTVVAPTTISEYHNAAIEPTSASIKTTSALNCSPTSLIRQPAYHNHCPCNRLRQKPPRPPKINTIRQKTHYILFVTILICVFQNLLYMPRKRTSSNMSTTSTNPSETSIRTRRSEDLTGTTLDQLGLNAVRPRRSRMQPEVTTVMETESDDEIEIVQVIPPPSRSATSNQGLGAIGNMVERDRASNPVYSSSSTVPSNITVMANVNDSTVGTPSTGGVLSTGGVASIEQATVTGGVSTKTSTALTSNTPPKISTTYVHNPYDNNAPMLRSTQKTPNRSNVTTRSEPRDQSTGTKL
jgi:hypothetical protein